MNTLKSAIEEAARGPAIRTESGSYIRTYRFEPDFIGFSGHFPGYPILPAVVQIYTLLSMAEAVKGCPLQLLSITKAKFHIEVYPGQDMQAEYREVVVKGKQTMECAITVSERVASTFMAVVSGKEEMNR